MRKKILVFICIVSGFVGWCIPTPGPLEDDFKPPTIHKVASKNAPPINQQKEEEDNIDDLIDELSEESPMCFFIYK